MNVDNVKSQMRKGMLEYCILLLLHKEPLYASDIILKLKEARLIVVEGTLYPLLTRLKNDELLSYEWVVVFYRKITEQAGSYLKEGGKLCFEIGYDQGDEVRELMETHGFADVQVLKDLAGLDRVVTGIWHKKP